jgi:WD40 repeat protein
MNYSDLVYSIDDAHSDMVRDLKFSPNVLEDFYTLASCSEDGLLCLTVLPQEMSAHTVIKSVVSCENSRFPVWKLCWNSTGRVVSGVSLGEDKRDSVVSVCKKAENFWAEL